MQAIYLTLLPEVKSNASKYDFDPWLGLKMSSAFQRTGNRFEGVTDVELMVHATC